MCKQQLIWLSAILLLVMLLQQRLLAAGSATLPADISIAPADESATLQSCLASTSEEWALIYPRIQRITDLRDEIPTAPSDAIVRPNILRGMLDSPLGGTSLDAPEMPTLGLLRLILPTRKGNAPFDPTNAPGKTTARIGRTRFGGAEGDGRRTFNKMMRTGRSGTVETLFNELQMLLRDKGATDMQVQDKLTAFRAARTQALRNLDEAEKDLVHLLTPDQIAVLVVLGYVD